MQRGMPAPVTRSTLPFRARSGLHPGIVIPSARRHADRIPERPSRYEALDFRGPQLIAAPRSLRSNLLATGDETDLLHRDRLTTRKSHEPGTARRAIIVSTIPKLVPALIACGF